MSEITNTENQNPAVTGSDAEQVAAAAPAPAQEQKKGPAPKGQTAKVKNQPVSEKKYRAKDIIAYLMQKFPKCFFDITTTDVRPLKIGILEDVVARLPDEIKPDGVYSKTAIRQGIKLYAATINYLQACKEGAVRVDLDGNDTDEIITADQAQYAVEKMAVVQEKMRKRAEEYAARKKAQQEQEQARAAAGETGAAEGEQQREPGSKPHGGYQKRQGGYQRRPGQGGYQKRQGWHGRPGQGRVEGAPEGQEGSQDQGQNQNQGYQRRPGPGGYQRRQGPGQGQGGYQRRPGQGGYQGRNFQSRPPRRPFNPHITYDFLPVDAGSLRRGSLVRVSTANGYVFGYVDKFTGDDVQVKTPNGIIVHTIIEAVKLAIPAAENAANSGSENKGA